jgi:hypothetical protein
VYQLAPVCSADYAHLLPSDRIMDLSTSAFESSSM